eukprot:TRINITY_DN634_c0_g1_i2.p1 TRINITY_DN634_c0_g1~~TRINITY_DN634_c0_g1_i2.p1  ORF type:complete len:216 (+),score=54.28 TRINITY_DN634_c0_g1_i2:88-648(+)
MKYILSLLAVSALCVALVAALPHDRLRVNAEIRTELAEATAQRGGSLLHAHCGLVWDFQNTSCDPVMTLIKNNVVNFTNPKVAENNYTLVSASQSEIKALHTSPVKQYVDDLSFNVVSTSATACTISAYSQSRPISLYDYDTNYCNLANLLYGWTSKYTETIGNKQGSCHWHPSQPGWGSEQCNKY